MSRLLLIPVLFIFAANELKYSEQVDSEILTKYTWLNSLSYIKQ